MKLLLRKAVFICIAFIAIISLRPATAQDDSPPVPRLFSEGLKYCEGTVPYKNMVLVSNFGCEELDPLNTQGKGYIMAIADGKLKMFIPNDGYLSAPKGMAILQGHLFVADVNKMVIYNLKRLGEKPQVVDFPEEDMFVNDIVAIGNLILASVTNTGRIYGIEAEDVSNLHGRKPTLMGDVPGANGMVVHDNMLYIASYNPSGTPSSENVIYYSDITSPNNSIIKLIPDLTPGQYDGIVVDEDGPTIYFTSWSGKNGAGEIYAYDLLRKGAVRTIDLGVKLIGPADICIKGDSLWIPDLPNSTVHRLPLSAE